MREHLLPLCHFESHVNPPHFADSKDFDQLIESLNSCINYHKKKEKLCVLSITIISIMVWAGIHIFPFLFPDVQSSLRDLNFYLGKNPAEIIIEIIGIICFVLVVLVAEYMVTGCIFLLGHFIFWRIREDIFYLSTTNEWQAFIEQQQYAPKLEDLTDNPQIIINFGNTLIALQQTCLALTKEQMNPLMTRKELAKRVTQFWKIPNWIFDDPERQLQKAAYHKVVAQLEQLFVDPPIPYDVTYVITNYLMPAPKFQI